MRYTKSRMTHLGAALMTERKKDTEIFAPNYDERLTEPTVSPSAFPNLLVNGGTGIAVGMATNIPPHNLGEIIDRSEEHTSELQSQSNLVCRLLLEKKKKTSISQLHSPIPQRCRARHSARS